CPAISSSGRSRPVMPAMSTPRARSKSRRIVRGLPAGARFLGFDARSVPPLDRLEITIADRRVPELPGQCPLARAAANALLKDKHAERDDGRPAPVLLALGGLLDRTRVHDLAAHAVDLFALVVVLVGVELDAHRRREHRRREVLGVVAGLLARLAVAVMLGEI